MHAANAVASSLRDPPRRSRRRPAGIRWANARAARATAARSTTCSTPPAHYLYEIVYAVNERANNSIQGLHNMFRLLSTTIWPTEKGRHPSPLPLRSLGQIANKLRCLLAVQRNQLLAREIGSVHYVLAPLLAIGRINGHSQGFEDQERTAYDWPRNCSDVPPSRGAVSHSL